MDNDEERKNPGCWERIKKSGNAHEDFLKCIRCFQAAAKAENHRTSR